MSSATGNMCDTLKWQLWAQIWTDMVPGGICLTLFLVHECREWLGPFSFLTYVLSFAYLLVPFESGNMLLLLSSLALLGSMLLGAGVGTLAALAARDSSVALVVWLSALTFTRSLARGAGKWYMPLLVFANITPAFAFLLAATAWFNPAVEVRWLALSLVRTACVTWGVHLVCRLLLGYSVSSNAVMRNHLSDILEALADMLRGTARLLVDSLDEQAWHVPASLKAAGSGTGPFDLEIQTTEALQTKDGNSSEIMGAPIQTHSVVTGESTNTEAPLHSAASADVIERAAILRQLRFTLREAVVDLPKMEMLAKWSCRVLFSGQHRTYHQLSKRLTEACWLVLEVCVYHPKSYTDPHVSAPTHPYDLKQWVPKHSPARSSEVRQEEEMPQQQPPPEFVRMWGKQKQSMEGMLVPRSAGIDEPSNLSKVKTSVETFPVETDLGPNNGPVAGPAPVAEGLDSSMDASNSWWRRLFGANLHTQDAQQTDFLNRAHRRDTTDPCEALSLPATPQGGPLCEATEDQNIEAEATNGASIAATSTVAVPIAAATTVAAPTGAARTEAAPTEAATTVTTKPMQSAGAEPTPHLSDSPTPPAAATPVSTTNSPTKLALARYTLAPPDPSSPSPSGSTSHAEIANPSDSPPAEAICIPSRCRPGRMLEAVERAFRTPGSSSPGPKPEEMSLSPPEPSAAQQRELVTQASSEADLSYKALVMPQTMEGMGWAAEEGQQSTVHSRPDAAGTQSLGEKSTSAAEAIKGFNTDEACQLAAHFRSNMVAKKGRNGSREEMALAQVKAEGPTRHQQQQQEEEEFCEVDPAVAAGSSPVATPSALGKDQYASPPTEPLPPQPMPEDPNTYSTYGPPTSMGSPSGPPVQDQPEGPPTLGPPEVQLPVGAQSGRGPAGGVAGMVPRAVVAAGMGKQGKKVRKGLRQNWDVAQLVALDEDSPVDAELPEMDQMQLKGRGGEGGGKQGRMSRLARGHHAGGGKHDLKTSVATFADEVACALDLMAALVAPVPLAGQLPTHLVTCFSPEWKLHPRQHPRRINSMTMPLPDIEQGHLSPATKQLVDQVLPPRSAKVDMVATLRPLLNAQMQNAEKAYQRYEHQLLQALQKAGGPLKAAQSTNAEQALNLMYFFSFSRYMLNTFYPLGDSVRDFTAASCMHWSPTLADWLHRPTPETVIPPSWKHNVPERSFFSTLTHRLHFSTIKSNLSNWRDTLRITILVTIMAAIGFGTLYWSVPHPLYGFSGLLFATMLLAMPGPVTGVLMTFVYMFSAWLGILVSMIVWATAKGDTYVGGTAAWLMLSLAFASFVARALPETAAACAMGGMFLVIPLAGYMNTLPVGGLDVTENALVQNWLVWLVKGAYYRLAAQHLAILLVSAVVTMLTLLLLFPRLASQKIRRVEAVGSRDLLLLCTAQQQIDAELRSGCLSGEFRTPAEVQEAVHLHQRGLWQLHGNFMAQLVQYNKLVQSAWEEPSFYGTFNPSLHRDLNMQLSKAANASMALCVLLLRPILAVSAKQQADDTMLQGFQKEAIANPLLNGDLQRVSLQLLQAVTQSLQTREPLLPPAVAPPLKFLLNRQTQGLRNAIQQFGTHSRHPICVSNWNEALGRVWIEMLLLLHLNSSVELNKAVRGAVRACSELHGYLMPPPAALTRSIRSPVQVLQQGFMSDLPHGGLPELPQDLAGRGLHDL